jgi:hypothetical protein
MSDAEAVHDGIIVIETITTPGASADAGIPTVRFNHYPGSQQVVLWLPRSWQEGYEDVSTTCGGVEIEGDAARNRVNGSVQIIWNTIAWPPGAYLIAISHKDGWRHEVALHKYAPGKEPKPEASPPSVEAPAQKGERVYRDGTGKAIPNVDLEMRAKAQEAIVQRFFGRHLEYEGTFRAGTITFVDGMRRIRFYHEMCGGDLHASIDVPTTDAWEKETGVSLAERDEIIAWVAERVRTEQASTWRYRITDRSIDFY